MATSPDQKVMSAPGVPHHAENREQKKVGIIIAVIAVVMTSHREWLFLPVRFTGCGLMGLDPRFYGSADLSVGI